VKTAGKLKEKIRITLKILIFSKSILKIIEKGIDKMNICLYNTLR
jgi:hypothetical protein